MLLVSRVLTVGNWILPVAGHCVWNAPVSRYHNILVTVDLLPTSQNLALLEVISIPHHLIQLFSEVTILFINICILVLFMFMFIPNDNCARCKMGIS